MKKKLVVIYMEDISSRGLDDLSAWLSKGIKKILPDTAYLITSKKLEVISLEEILPWLKRLVKEAEA